MVLVAVLPPDHVLDHAYRAQDDLFRRYGLASTRALPPIIPVGYRGTSAQDTPPPPLSSSDWGFSPFQIASVCVRDGHLIAETTLAASCAQLAVSLALPHPEETARESVPSFPLGSLFLGEAEDTASPKISEPPLGTDALYVGLIRSASLIQIEIETAPSKTSWWHSVRWRITELCRFRAASPE
ncbi:MAG: hypothetical protein EA403_13300 [Spirochaetaceae bacterium]|nr:MAG: hypothetical protein EA403_13300 [Spirochaetaceae bacterium]